MTDERSRQDFSTLMDLRRRHGVRLVFFHDDLLGTLPAGNPRLADRSATDLPGTDFVAREADLILAISHFSAEVLRDSLAARALACPPIEVIALAGQLDTQVGEPVEGVAPGSFVLAVGDIVARKNHAILATVRERLIWQGVSPPLLVMAGNVHAEGAELCRRLSGDPLLKPHMRVLPSVADRQLAWLYAQRRFTVFPSLAEGFGLPVAESLAAGKPCIASNAMAIPEASQGAAIHLDPHDADAWTDTVRRLATDEAALESERRRVVATFRPVSWADTAAQSAAFIETYLGPAA